MEKGDQIPWKLVKITPFRRVAFAVLQPDLIRALLTLPFQPGETSAESLQPVQNHRIGQMPVIPRQNPFVNSR